MSDREKRKDFDFPPIPVFFPFIIGEVLYQSDKSTREASTTRKIRKEIIPRNDHGGINESSLGFWDIALGTPIFLTGFTASYFLVVWIKQALTKLFF